jgi:Tup N-terminal
MTMLWLCLSKVGWNVLKRRYRRQSYLWVCMRNIKEGLPLCPTPLHLLSLRSSALFPSPSSPMSSTIYNVTTQFRIQFLVLNALFSQHRSLQPTGPPVPGGSHSQARLNESLDIVRQEFVELTNELNNIRGQRDEYEAKSGSPSFFFLCHFN